MYSLTEEKHTKICRGDMTQQSGLDINTVHVALQAADTLQLCPCCEKLPYQASSAGMKVLYKPTGTSTGFWSY